MSLASQSSDKKKTLEDVQGRPDERGIALEHAGVSQVEMPLRILQKNGETQTVSASVDMSVGLDASEKGTHMSRFILQLKEWSQDKVFSIQLKDFLVEMKERLHAPSATVCVRFKYFTDKAAPVSKLEAPAGHEIEFRGHINLKNQIVLLMRVHAPLATLCPCSKAISDFGAHNQRAIASVDLLLEESGEGHPVVWIEDILSEIDEAASCPVYPLLKRSDEKWVTERQYSNAKFVEDVVRDLCLALREQKGIDGYRVKVEALESIHGHNAWASHAEGQSISDF